MAYASCRQPLFGWCEFLGISCPDIIWSFVQMTGSQCCDVMWPQIRSVVCVRGVCVCVWDVIKRKQQAKPTEKQRTNYFAKCTGNDLTNTKKHHVWVSFFIYFWGLGLPLAPLDHLGPTLESQGFRPTIQVRIFKHFASKSANRGSEVVFWSGLFLDPRLDPTLTTKTIPPKANFVKGAQCG